MYNTQACKCSTVHLQATFMRHVQKIHGFSVGPSAHRLIHKAFYDALLIFYKKLSSRWRCWQTSTMH